MKYHTVGGDESSGQGKEIMESRVSGGAMPLGANGPSTTLAAGTRALLRLGMLAGPFYLAVGLTQALLRDGFDFSRHALSHLANGPGGWVQTTNFVLSGLMVIGAAVGFARVLGPNARAVRWCLGGFGASMLVAAIFPADPVYGFPVGTPAGDPTLISTRGMVHFVAGALGFILLGVSCFFAAAALSRAQALWLARLSFFSGLVILVGFFGGAMLGGAGILGIWISVVVGWAWLAVVSRHLYRRVPDPGSLPSAL